MRRLGCFRPLTAVGLALASAITLRRADSFVIGRFPSSRRSTTTTAEHASTTRLCYKDGNHTEHTAASSTSSKAAAALEIPILCPLLNVAKPLIVGESLTMDHLTPGQWKTIEACVEAQQQQNDENDDSNMATIDQAPLVAILHTGQRNFATLAAVVGISSGFSSTHSDDNDSVLDTSSSTSLQESLLGLSSASSQLYNDASKVRLMGIGRAKLSQQHVKTSGDEDQPNDSSSDEPILMAKMQACICCLKL